MTQMYDRWEIVTIGEVVSPIKEPISPDLFHNIRCTIKIYPEFAEGLLGLEEGKDILVLFLFHLNIGKAPLLVHPRGTPRSPYEGICHMFPYKANSIRTNRCRLIALNGLDLDLVGLEAIDGTLLSALNPFRV